MPNSFSANFTNGQTRSNNSSAIADELLSVFDHFVGFALKGLIEQWKLINWEHAVPCKGHALPYKEYALPYKFNLLKRQASERPELCGRSWDVTKTHSVFA